MVDNYRDYIVINILLDQRLNLSPQCDTLRNNHN